MDKNQVFNLLQAGRGTINPLSDLGSLADSKTQGALTQLASLNNVTAIKQQALSLAGINTGYIGAVESALNGNLVGIGQLVSYGDESVKNLYSRINIASNYASTMQKYGVLTECTPFNSVLSIVGGVGQTCLNAVTEAVGGAVDSLAEFLGLDDAADLLAKAQALKSTLDGALQSIATFVQDVTDYISEEAALLQEYMTTAINSALTDVLGDWYSAECTSSIMDTVLSPEIRGYL